MRFAVWISGRGSNLRSLLESPQGGQIHLVVSNKKKALGLGHAKRYGVPTFVSPLRTQGAWHDLYQLHLTYKIDVIFLAGFMKIVPEAFLKWWDQRPILNLHPSLLPSYPGLNSIGRAYKDKAPMGATVHFVTAGLDEGPIFLQEQVQGYHSLESAEFLVHLAEQRLLTKALRIFASCK